MDAVKRMILSLQGLSVGDGFGECFFAGEDGVKEMLLHRRLPPPPWHYTDDTEMALSVVEVLQRAGHLDPDLLAASFVRRYTPWRGYGFGAHALLRSLSDGASWREEAPSMFGGQGSFGNGAAMRVAPLGAYFANDLDAVCRNAERSAAPTHAHAEGIAGAVAVAVAAALAWRVREGEAMTPRRFLECVTERVPAGETYEGLKRVADMTFEATAAGTGAGMNPDIAPERVAAAVGSGANISSQDTVPFALWCAARHLDDYVEALWATASGLGDVDTTCAIVGGIVVLSDGGTGIPESWSGAREALPRGFRLDRD